MLVDTFSKILKEHSLTSSFCVFEDVANKHYVFLVDNLDFDTIVDMNFKLVEKIVSIQELDSCDFIVRVESK